MELVSESTAYSRCLTATNATQTQSLAEEKQCVRYCKYSSISLNNRQFYFDISCVPITMKAENDMEMLSDLIGIPGELYVQEFRPGTYVCARCNTSLFRNDDKWKGPCIWPSFRKGISTDALTVPDVLNYNEYKCRVGEVYCGSCDLFIGHRFEDGKLKGDTHEHAQWRY